MGSVFTVFYFPFQSESHKLQLRLCDNRGRAPSLCCLGGFRGKHFEHAVSHSSPVLSSCPCWVCGGMMSDSVVYNTLSSLGSVAYKSSIKTIGWHIPLNGVLRFCWLLFRYVWLQKRHPCKGLLFKTSLVSSLSLKAIFLQIPFISFFPILCKTVREEPVSSLMSV